MTATTTLTRTALLISLKGGPNLPEPLIRSLLASEAARAATHPTKPFLLINHLIGLDRSTSLPTILKETKAVLANHRFDCVLIGFGIRGNPRYTEVFEGLVNTVVESEAGKGVKLGFPTNPSGVVEAAVEFLPEGEGREGRESKV